MNIGLIAHDSKKKLMQNFCIAYRGILNKNQLFATGTTGQLIEEVTNLSVHKFLAGRLGGAVNPKSYEPNSERISILCDMYNIPLATNLATAELLIKSLERGDMEWREIYQ